MTPPAVTAVVPTKDRPDLLREAIDAITAQDYPGDVHCMVVYDGTRPDETVRRRGPGRTVDVTMNSGPPGLAGTRNTGVRLARTPLVAFCDDDDTWLPGKLTAQVEQLACAPDAVVAGCGIRVEYADRAVLDRTLPAAPVELDELLRSRITALHSSSLLFRRDRLIDIGLVNDEVPGGYGEDYELLLRAARVHPVVTVPEIHVVVRWHDASHFTWQWDTRAAALEWLLRAYPEFRRVPAGEARIAGQVAFAHAAGGRRRAALRWTGRALRRNPREARAYLALAVVSGALRPGTVLRQLHRRGRGI